MCKCNPSIRTLVCKNCIRINEKDSCETAEELTEKKLKINLAMETDDLIYVDELLVRPQGIHNNRLDYMNLMTLGCEFCDLNKVEIKSYDE